VKCSKF